MIAVAGIDAGSSMSKGGHACVLVAETDNSTASRCLPGFARRPPCLAGFARCPPCSQGGGAGAAVYLRVGVVVAAFKHSFIFSMRSLVRAKGVSWLEFLRVIGFMIAEGADLSTQFPLCLLRTKLALAFCQT